MTGMVIIRPVLLLILQVPIVAHTVSFGAAVGTTMHGTVGLRGATGTRLECGTTTSGSAWFCPQVSKGEPIVS